MTDVTPAASLSGVTLDRRVVGVDLAVERGACVVLVGKNGAGKSTLLELLGGLLVPTSGQVRLSGVLTAHLGELGRAALAAWLPQRPGIEGLLTAREVVTLARYRFGESPREARAFAERHLERAGAGHLGERRVDSMSGGEMQRVLMAALRAQEAPLLLVDEPANHLDPLAQVHAYRALGQLWQDEGATLCLVTHDLRLCQLLGPTDRILVIGVAEGRLAWRLPLSAPELASALEALYGVPFVSAGAPGGLGIAVDLLGGSAT